MDRAFRADDQHLARDRDDRAWLAWHIAVLVRWPYPRKGKNVPPFPKLDALSGKRPARREMTPDEQWRLMSAMAEPSTATH